MILLGVHHIHEKKIIHRDLKLENIIMKFKIQNFKQVIDEIKIVDFGCGVNSDAKAKGLMGTPQYMPPEALMKKPYNDKFDMWSLGVILYVTIVGNFPFTGVDVKDLFDNIKNQNIDFNSENLNGMSSECRDFISKIL